MTFIPRYITYSTLGLALLAAGFWFGFNEGAKAGVLLDSIPRGSISLAYLEKVKTYQGISKNMVTAFESDIDVGLLFAHRLEEHPLFPVLEPLWGLPVSHAKAPLMRLATYRHSHPSPLRAEALSAEPFPDSAEGAALRKETLDGARRTDEAISSMVSRYAAPATAR
jgi:hypothetical protein